MESLAYSAVFPSAPLVIRARLSTEDSTSDASSSEDNAGEVEEEGYGVSSDAGEEPGDDLVSPAAVLLPWRLSMPIARVTGEDEDENVIEDEEGEESQNPKLALWDLVVGSSSVEGDEDLDGVLMDGEEESGFSYWRDEKDGRLNDEGPVIAAVEEFPVGEEEKDYVDEAGKGAAPFDNADYDEGGMDSNVVNIEMDDIGVVKEVSNNSVQNLGEDVDSSVIVHDKFQDAGYRDVKQNNDFALELRDIVVDLSAMDSKEIIVSGDIDATQKFAVGVELRALQPEAHTANLDIAGAGAVSSQNWNEEAVEGVLVLNDVMVEGSEVVEEEVADIPGQILEEDIDSSAVAYEDVGATIFRNVNQSNVFSLDLKDVLVESSTMDLEKIDSGDIASTQKFSVAEMRAMQGVTQAVNLDISENEYNTADYAGAVSLSQHWNGELESMATGAEFAFLDDLNIKDAGDTDSKNDLVTENMLEASDVEADFAESEEFEANNACGHSHGQILEMVSLPSQAFEPELPELNPDNCELEKKKDLYINDNPLNSEKAKGSASKFHTFAGHVGVHYSSSSVKENSLKDAVAYPEHVLSNYNYTEKHDESGAVVAEDCISENYNSWEASFDTISSFYLSEKEGESSFDRFHVAHDYESGEDEELVISEWPSHLSVQENAETMKHIINELEEGSSFPHGFQSLMNYSPILDRQIISTSDEETGTDEDVSAKELFDTFALAASSRVASGTPAGGAADFTSQHVISSFKHPASFSSVVSYLSSTNAPLQSAQNFTFSDLAIAGEPVYDMNEEEKMLHLRVEQIRIKYLRLVQRLGYSADDALTSHVLYQLGLADGLRGRKQISEEFCLERAKKKALQLEQDGKDEFIFSCNILVLGKTGVGKSAVINSIFIEERASTDPFQPATTSVRKISKVVDGFYIHVIDTPGLRTSLIDQGVNRKILSSIKKHTKKCPPDVVLYVDRLDAHTLDFSELPLLRMITRIFGSSIWFNTIISLTHAASAFLDGPDGSSLSNEVVVTQRSHLVQQSIRLAAGDMRLVNSVALMENHPSCSRNMLGESLLPSGLRWRPQLLLMCYSVKTLSEVNSLRKLKVPSQQNHFSFHSRILPAFLSSLLRPKVHPKVSTEQGDEKYDPDMDLDNMLDRGQEEGDEYDQLPPFKPSRKSQIEKLTKEHRNSYFDEYNYRVELLQRKQLEELIRLKNIMEGTGDPDELTPILEDFDHSSVSMLVPDIMLPPSFDCEIPTYRYRFLEPSSHFLVKPVLHTRNWDHDYGSDDVIIDESVYVASQFPIELAAKIMKDKNEFSMHLDFSIASQREQRGSTLATFNIHLVGRQLANTLQGETKFKILKNDNAAGISAASLSETMINGFKLEDRILLGKSLLLVASAGAVQAQRDVAYGANVELHLRKKDFSIGKALCTLGLSLLKWWDFAVGANFQTQFSTGRNSKLAVRVGLNNENRGNITIKACTSEHLHIAIVSLCPLLLSISRSIWPSKTSLVK